MLQFVTDVQEGETDILCSVKRKELLVLGPDGRRIDVVPAPAKGWTHEALEEHARMLQDKTCSVADAFLGGEWVGSTEV